MYLLLQHNYEGTYHQYIPRLKLSTQPIYKQARTKGGHPKCLQSICLITETSGAVAVGSNSPNT